MTLPVPIDTPRALVDLAEAGVAVWLDDLSRPLVRQGGLADLVRTRGVIGVTSNPSIFATSVAGTDAYTPQLAQLANAGRDAEAAVRTLTTDDVRDACDVLAEVYASTDGVDGRVSIEVDPRLAHDTEATVAQARELWDTVDRPNLFIKIPATVEGLPAITRTLAAGISVNVTLIFSLERYREVIEAHLDGLAQAKAAGHDLSRLASVASFFVSRVDTAVDGRLEEIGGDAAEALLGTAAIANARLAYRLWEQYQDDPRWTELAAAGALTQRPLWASTSVKNPAYPDTRYVDELVAPHTVNTMPGSTLEQVGDHGQVTGDTARAFDDADRVMASLADVGVDMAEVTDELEAQGVQKFIDSWQDLLGTVDEALKAHR
ncbi:transaldolase [Isoptericola sp. b441]|uniref:Transaldolase n=1 Tax=Actinotalea lenta TaxID=3064654 RepID=A0ABT9DAU3_9CELL|nr:MULTISPECIES: transaldolase [unclassified Isoptericola]MDO8107680.1 transaldolase [Isoptericola sp. b441]MDO8120660.1 transaldolase [Isoptericola sp. b490]